MKKVGVSCRNVRLSYGKTEVLRDVNLDIEPVEKPENVAWVDPTHPAPNA